MLYVDVLNISSRFCKYIVTWIIHFICDNNILFLYTNGVVVVLDIFTYSRPLIGSYTSKTITNKLLFLRRRPVRVWTRFAASLDHE